MFVYYLLQSFLLFASFSRSHSILPSPRDNSLILGHARVQLLSTLSRLKSSSSVQKLAFPAMPRGAHLLVVDSLRPPARELLLSKTGRSRRSQLLRLKYM